jgi:hypothetical protein
MRPNSSQGGTSASSQYVNEKRGEPQMQEYLKNVSPEMINFGLHAGQDILKKQRERLMPGVAGFVSSLRYYFAVSNSYVLKKLMLILYPVKNTQWSRLHADEFEHGENDQVSRKWALPKHDVNAPDLYIPLMSFVTYCLLCGLSRGMGSSNFSPDVIIQSIWRCLLLQIIETAAIKFTTNYLAVSVFFVDIFAITGYKYVGLSINTLTRIMNGYLNILVTFYTSAMIAYFVLKTLASMVPQSSGQENGSTRVMILFGFGVVQLLLILFLSWM